MRKAIIGCVIALLTGCAFLIIRLGTARDALVAGAILVAAGFPLLVLSRIQLGKAFSVAPRASTLVTHGLYSRIPHPMYVFLDLTLLGVVIALRQEWLLAAWLCLVAVQSWRAGQEAAVLERAFGEAYRKYRQETWW
jgi:protein-S-isoprenylcysteine O-methyltransferase Ste14